MSEKSVYFFGDDGAEGRGDMKDLLGGKGAGLAEMARAGIPVPPGFTITTRACLLYQDAGGKLPESIDAEMWDALGRLERVNGRRLGDADNPLLVSVRSGAKISMPGMMDTILNLGLNDKTTPRFAATTQNPRFAWDCYRRFIQMFGDVVLGIEKSAFEHVLDAHKKKSKARTDADLTPATLQKIVADYKKLVKQRSGRDFPQDPREQLVMARDAVFQSWNNPRAVTYRRLNHIPHDLGTAVNVQTMVFGNTGMESGTGVGFTRNPSNGNKEFYGEYLLNAQGEDVVAGVRTPEPLAHLEEVLPDAYAQLHDITQRLEKHYRDVQDFEFTIQDAKLYMLQTRTGKRTGIAALKIACDMVEEGIITKEEALLRVEPASLNQLLHPVFDPAARKKIAVDARGLAASPGAASGTVVFTADDAEREARKGRAVVLVRKETVPDDIHGMHASRGVLTATGGMTSHAAVVGRQMGKPSVVGCSALHIDEKKKTLRVGKKTLREGDPISIDGTTGEVMLSEVATRPPEILQVISGKLAKAKSPTYQYFERFLGWADGVRTLGVRANADTPGDARTAMAFGAQGIGLARTEHMFFAEDRLKIVQDLIMAAPVGQQGLEKLNALRQEKKEKRRPAKAIDADIKAAERTYGKQVKRYTEDLAKLLPFQRRDFEGLFREMKGNPVTVRLLDPPMHEFLPKRDELIEQRALLSKKRDEASKRKLRKLDKLWEAVDSLHEFNPMLGHRGCRLGIIYPEITRMQARAIFEAACNVAKKGQPVKPEVMVPLVGHVKELAIQKALIIEVAEEVMAKKGVKLDYLVGTMIEVPRAALTADEIAGEAQFFSFGTNDLTQMGIGLSRDDAGRFLPDYVAREIYAKDPFVSLDQDGVGQLVQIATEKGRSRRPNLKVGICGEHGGDPDSVGFFHKVGLDYVSCSPYRLPIARLAAAQATLRSRNGRPEVARSKAREGSKPAAGVSG